MIPSLLVSVAGAIVLTRASSDSTLGMDVGQQLFGKRRPLWIAAGVMGGLALIPGLPKLSFILMAASDGRSWPAVSSTEIAADAAAEGRRE